VCILRVSGHIGKLLGVLRRGSVRVLLGTCEVAGAVATRGLQRLAGSFPEGCAGKSPGRNGAG